MYPLCLDEILFFSIMIIKFFVQAHETLLDIWLATSSLLMHEE